MLNFAWQMLVVYKMFPGRAKSAAVETDWRLGLCGLLYLSTQIFLCFSVLYDRLSFWICSSCGSANTCSSSSLPCRQPDLVVAVLHVAAAMAALCSLLQCITSSRGTSSEAAQSTCRLSAASRILGALCLLLRCFTEKWEQAEPVSRSWSIALQSLCFPLPFPLQLYVGALEYTTYLITISVNAHRQLSCAWELLQSACLGFLIAVVIPSYTLYTLQRRNRVRRLSKGLNQKMVATNDIQTTGGMAVERVQTPRSGSDVLPMASVQFRFAGDQGTSDPKERVETVALSSEQSLNLLDVIDSVSFGGEPLFYKPTVNCLTLSVKVETYPKVLSFTAAAECLTGAVSSAVEALSVKEQLMVFPCQVPFCVEGCVHLMADFAVDLQATSAELLHVEVPYLPLDCSKSTRQQLCSCEGHLLKRFGLVSKADNACAARVTQAFQTFPCCHVLLSRLAVGFHTKAEGESVTVQFHSATRVLAARLVLGQRGVVLLDEDLVPAQTSCTDGGFVAEFQVLLPMLELGPVHVYVLPSRRRHSSTQARAPCAPLARASLLCVPNDCAFEIQQYCARQYRLQGRGAVLGRAEHLERRTSSSLAALCSEFGMLLLGNGPCMAAARAQLLSLFASQAMPACAKLLLGCCGGLPLHCYVQFASKDGMWQKPAGGALALQQPSPVL